MFSKIKPYIIVILVLATPLSTFVLSFQFNNQEHLSTVLVDESSPVNDAFTSKANNGLQWSATSGLSGDLTTPPIIDVTNETGNEEIIYLGTEVGLTKITIEFGDILWFHPTPGALLSITPVDDVSSDGYKDVLITIDNQQFNNTEMLDGRTGEVLWTFRPTENVWLEGIGFSEQETRSWSGLELEDLTLDGFNEVLISSYKTIYALDGTNGYFLWEYEASNDIWSTEMLDDDINTDGTKDIIFGSQDGELTVVNGKDGSKLWSIQAAEQEFFEDLDGIEHTINRNVYDIQLIDDLNLDGKNDIIVTTENGYCSVYDVVNGQLIDRVLVFSRTGGFGDQAIFGDTDFYNVLYFDTVSNYASPIGLTASRTKSALGNSSLSAISLTSNDLMVEWTTTSIDFDEVREIATTVVEDIHGNYTKMIVPSGAESAKDVKTIQVYALHNRSLLYEWEISVFSESIDLAINFDDQGKSDYPFSGNYAFVVDDLYGAAENEVLIYFAGNGLYLLDGDNGELIWRQTNVVNVNVYPFVDVNSDSTVDILQESHYLPDDYQSNKFTISRFSLIDGTTGDLIWDHQIDYYEQQMVNGGYHKIIQADDLTGDTIPDFWLISREWMNFEPSLQNASRVKMLDGATGVVVWDVLPTNSSWVWSKEMLKITSATQVSDQNSDSIQDILVGCQRGFVYCLSGSTGDYLWNITRETDFSDPHYRDWVPYSPQLINVGNILGSPQDDIVLLGDGRVVMVDSVDFTTVHWTWVHTTGWLEEEAYQIHVNIAENETYLIMNYFSNEDNLIGFLNLQSGLIDYNIYGTFNQISLDLFVDDFNNDAINDHLMFKAYGDENYQDGYYVISGATGTALSFYSLTNKPFETNRWIVEQLFYLGIRNFFDIYDDVNFDGIPEIVVGWSIGQYDYDDISQGMVVEIVSMHAIQGEVIESFEIMELRRDQYSNPPLIPAGFVQNIGDITGDGFSDILVSLVNLDGQFITTIYDIASGGEIWKEISDIIYSSIIPQELNGTLTDNLIVTDIYGRVRVIDNTYTVEITDFEVIKKGIGKYQLAWDSTATDIITTIYIDGEKIDTVFTSETEVYLTNGEHLVSVAICDRNGISAYANYPISIENTGGVFVLWLIIGGITFGYIGLSLFFKFKRKEDLSDFGPDKNL